MSDDDTQVSGREIMETLLNAIGEWDRETFKSIITEDAEWWFGPSIASHNSVPRPISGRDAVLAGVIPPQPAFAKSTTTWTLLHVVQQGDLVATHAERDCTTARGLPYRVEYHFLAELRNSQIAKFWDIMDTQAALEQVFPPD
jgi:ketosteroid isomerase-like protein